MNFSYRVHKCLARPALFLICIGVLGSANQTSGQSAYSLAMMKSQRMAQLGIQRLVAPKSGSSIAPYGMRHVYPFRRPAGSRLFRSEGVGYSPFSASDAIRNACHYGRRPIRTSAVVRGRDGYYATVFYR
jgi:hypothetical protein